MRRLVLDTNVLVGSAYDEFSAEWQIIADVLRGKYTLLVSTPLRREYGKILRTAVSVRGHEKQMERLLAVAEDVPLSDIPRVVAEDPDDDKVIATAVAGRAAVVLTNDRHLLALDPYAGIRILTPRALRDIQKAEGDEQWRDLAKLVGLTK